MLHCTPREAQGRLTSSEFADYIELFRRRDKARLTRNQKWEYYAAAIIGEVRRGWVTKKGEIKNSDYLLKFEIDSSDEGKPEKTPVSEEELKNRQLAVEKYSWAVMSGAIAPVAKRKK